MKGVVINYPNFKYRKVRITWEYRHDTIQNENDFVMINDAHFGSLDQAQTWVENQIPVRTTIPYNPNLKLNIVYLDEIGNSGENHRIATYECSY
jgi:hypothetical protein